MTLATLAMVKAKLDLSPADTSLDLPIQNVLSAASELVRVETGYDDEVTTHTEILTGTPYEAFIITKFRPVDAVFGVSVQARSYGETTLVDVSADLVDAPNGRIKLVAGQAPYSPDADSDGEYDVLEVVYKTEPATPLDVVDATAELAAFWFREHRANAASVSVGLASESYLNLPVPPSVLTVLWRNKRKVARWA